MGSHSLPIIEVTAASIDADGFFCRMSKMKTAGNQQKLAWAKERFDEELGLTLLGEGQRGFVEVMPGEQCWRPITADGWDVIHCLWVVGTSKGHGAGAALLEQVLTGARARRRHGVAVVTREKNWVTPRSFFEHHGFTVVDEGVDGFVLMALPFSKKPPAPRFVTDDWQGRLAHHRKDLVVFRTAQCPYIDDAVAGVVAVGKELHIPVHVVEWRSAAEVRQSAPSPYGTFAVALDGKLLTSTYELPAALRKKIAAARA